MKKRVIILMTCILMLAVFALGTFAVAADLPDETGIEAMPEPTDVRTISEETTIEAIPEDPNLITVTEEDFLPAEQPQAGYAPRNAASLPAGMRSALKNAILNCSNSVDVSSYNLTLTDGVRQLIRNYVRESGYPMFFNVKGLSYQYYTDNNQLAIVVFTYHYSASVFNSMRSKIETEAGKMLSGIRGNSSLGEKEKALLLHDRLALRCEYDPVAIQTNLNSQSDNADNLYGAIVSRRAICEGYAKAYWYLLEQVGIDCGMVTSRSLNHAWNIVYIDDTAYHVDVTRDDPSYDASGRVHHDNFLVSTTKLRSNHAASDYNTAPSDTRYDNYFWRNSCAAFTLVGNEIYYIDSRAGALKKYSTRGTVATVPGDWNGIAMGGTGFSCFARLASDGSGLLYNSKNTVYRYNPSARTSSAVFTPSAATGNKMIFGMTYENGNIICEVTTSSVYTANTKAQSRVTRAYTPPTPAPTPTTKETLASSRVTLSWTTRNYNGQVQKPTVTVRNAAGNVMTLDKSYSLSYSNANSKAPGTYTVTVTGKGKYTGTVTKTYTITKQPLDASRVTLSWTSRTYNCAAQRPTVTVKNAAGYTMTKNASYTLSLPKESETPGTYTVTATGKGNYTGTVTKTYRITKQPLDASRVTLSWTSRTYNCAAQRPTVTVKNAAGYTMTKNASYTLSLPKESETPGTYTVTATGKGNYTGTVTKTYRITKQPLDASRVTLSWTSRTYNGDVQRPTVTVKNAAGYAMTKNASFTVSYSSDSRYTGTYRVTVTGKGNYTGSVTKTYRIAPQPLDASRVTLSQTSFTYNGKVQRPTVTVRSAAGGVMTEDRSYTVTYSSGCKARGTYTVTVTGMDCYTGSVSKTFTIR